MTARSYYPTLRAEIDRGLARLQADDAPLEDALRDLVKAAVALSLPLIGAEQTIAGLRALARQLEAEFPAEAERVRRDEAMSGPAAGRA